MRIPHCHSTNNSPLHRAAYVTLLVSYIPAAAFLFFATAANPVYSQAVVSKLPHATPSNSMMQTLDGYNGLAWGSSMEAVVAKYPTIWYDPNPDVDFNNSVRGKAKYVTGPIKERTFVFVDGKLVRVNVDYAPREVSFDQIQHEVSGKYGQAYASGSRDITTPFGPAQMTETKWKANNTFIALRNLTGQQLGAEALTLAYTSKLHYDLYIKNLAPNQFEF